MPETTPNKPDMWAIVEVMGHQKYVGRVTEEVMAGSGFVRVDVPENGDVAAFTKPGDDELCPRCLQSPCICPGFDGDAGGAA